MGLISFFDSRKLYATKWRLGLHSTYMVLFKYNYDATKLWYSETCL